MNPGIAYAALAYVAWGLFPLFFRALKSVPSLEVMMHRLVWCLASLAVIVIVTRRWAWMRTLWSQPREVLRLVLGAVLIFLNWSVYIWATQHDHVVDASLGYYITPLVNVLLGRVFLGEQLRPVQRTAIAFATIGCAWLSWESGHWPWIGVSIAVCFGGYGLLKKTMTLGSFESLVVETAMLFPFACAGLAWLAADGSDHFTSSDGWIRAMLVASGPITAVPLLLFAAGARRISMTTLGLLQYISPTIQLLLAVFVLGEVLTRGALAGYVLVWIGLAIYVADGVRRRRPEPVVDT